MAAKTKTITTYYDVTDDVDGSSLPDGTEPIPFAHDGTNYEIFLGKSNAKKLTDALDTVATFVGHAKKVGGTSTASASNGSASSNGKPSLYSTLSDDEKAAVKDFVAAEYNKTGARSFTDERVRAWQASTKKK